MSLLRSNGTIALQTAHVGAIGDSLLPQRGHQLDTAGAVGGQQTRRQRHGAERDRPARRARRDRKGRRRTAASAAADRRTPRLRPPSSSPAPIEPRALAHHQLNDLTALRADRLSAPRSLCSGRSPTTTARHRARRGKDVATIANPISSCMANVAAPSTGAGSRAMVVIRSTADVGSIARSSDARARPALRIAGRANDEVLRERARLPERQIDFGLGRLAQMPRCACRRSRRRSSIGLSVAARELERGADRRHGPA